MTNQYWERVKDTLFEYSNESKDINTARREWRYFGEVIDNRYARVSVAEQARVDVNEYPNCELCNHPNIRNSFTIRNMENENELKVGSECITKFIEVDQNGEIIKDPIGKKKILNRDVRKLIKDRRRNEIISNILAIKKHDDTFPVDSFLEWIDDKEGFTLNQLKWLVKEFKTYGITYDLLNYRVKLRKKKDRQQLFGLKKWQFDNFKPIIPVKFQEEYLKQN